MKVSAEISKFDLIKFNIAVIPRDRSTYTSVLSLAILVFVLLCWLRGFPQCAREWYAISAGTAGGATLGFLIGIVFSVSSILSSSSTENGILGIHEYTLTDEGLSEKTKANVGLSNWGGILKVAVYGRYLFFQVSSFTYHIVPIRSFESYEDYKEFAQRALDLWEAAQSK